MPEITSYERGYHQGVQDTHELDHDIKAALAQALGESKMRITDRRMLILYFVNLVMLIVVTVALFKR